MKCEKATWSTYCIKIYATSSCWCCECEHKFFPISHFSTQIHLPCEASMTPTPLIASSAASQTQTLFTAPNPVPAHWSSSLSAAPPFFSLLLYSLVLFDGIQRQPQRPLATTTISNCDFVTCNILALELIIMLACGIYLVGIYTFQHELMKTGISAVHLVFHGRLLFHCLTCVRGSHASHHLPESENRKRCFC